MARNDPSDNGEHHAGFTMIPNTAIHRANEVGLAALGLYDLIVNHINQKDGYAEIKEERLAMMGDASERNVRRLIQKLEAAKLIIADRRKGGQCIRFYAPHHRYFKEPPPDRTPDKNDRGSPAKNDREKEGTPDKNDTDPGQKRHRTPDKNDPPHLTRVFNKSLEQDSHSSSSSSARENVVAAAAENKEPTYQEFQEAWDAMAAQVNLKPATPTPRRKQQFAERILDPTWRASWREALELIPSSNDWCLGRTKKAFQANVDWFLKPDAVPKLLAREFHDKTAKPRPEQNETAYQKACEEHDSRKITPPPTGEERRLFRELWDACPQPACYVTVTAVDGHKRAAFIAWRELAPSPDLHAILLRALAEFKAKHPNPFDFPGLDQWLTERRWENGSAR